MVSELKEVEKEDGEGDASEMFEVVVVVDDCERVMVWAGEDETATFP